MQSKVVARLTLLVAITVLHRRLSRCTWGGSLVPTEALGSTRANLFLTLSQAGQTVVYVSDVGNFVIRKLVLVITPERSSVTQP